VIDILEPLRYFSDCPKIAFKNSYSQFKDGTTKTRPEWFREYIVGPLHPNPGEKPDFVSAITVFVAFGVPTFVGLAFSQPLLAFIAGFVAWVTLRTDIGASLERRLVNAFSTVIFAGAILFLGPLALRGAWTTVIYVVILAAILSITSVVGNADRRRTPLMFLVAGSVSIPVSLYTGIDIGIAALVGGAWGTLCVIGQYCLTARRSDPVIAIINTTVAALQCLSAPDSPRLTDLRQTVGRVIDDAFREARFAFRHRSERIVAIESIDRIFISTIALTQIAGYDRSPDRERVLSELSDAIGALLLEYRDAPEPDNATANANAQFDRALQSLQSARSHFEIHGFGEGFAPIDSIAGAVTDLSRVGVNTRGDVDVATAPFGMSSVRRIRAHITPDSIYFRFMVRFTLAQFVASALYALLEIPEGYWISITVTVVMKPQFTHTLEALVQRTTGTIVGVAIGGALAVMIGPNHWLTAVACTSFIVLAFLLGRLNYMYWVLAITPWVILSLGFLMATGWDIAYWRLLNTVVGALLAAISTLVILASRGNQMLPRLTRQTFAAMAQLLDAWRQREDTDYLRIVRQQLALTVVTFSDAVAEYRHEPGRQPQRIEFYDYLWHSGIRIRDRIIALTFARPSHFGALTDQQDELARKCSNAMLTLTDIPRLPVSALANTGTTLSAAPPRRADRTASDRVDVVYAILSDLDSMISKTAADLIKKRAALP